jgi:ATP/maltotriose-dependent transcriptional regulator MalT
MPENLLRTKLFPPPPRPSEVTRKALLDKFTQARQSGISCVLVSAPAGFGKTSLVVDCVHASGGPFAWLALDEGDNDLLRFWRYVDAALAAIDARIGEELRPALYAAQTPAIQQIITGLVNDIISLEKELILVLDDYHVIELSTIHDSLNYLLDHLPPQMGLVVITRSDPPLNLARRRGRGQLIEIRATDLRFTPEETAAFLNETMLLGLAEADIASLGQRTEGWIAGLQMAALSMQDEIDPHHFVAAFSGDDRHIADYLVEEVLQRQLVEVQRFLLQTSILDRLNASLCDAVTGRTDSRAMLNTLERANLFIQPLDSRREWFRYHTLFAELLRQRLRETLTGEAVASLHRAAADWYESQGDIAAAIRHARIIPDDHFILRILERNVGRFFTSGELPQLFELASLLPAELRKESPFLCISVAWAALAFNRYNEVPAWLDSIEMHFGISSESALHDSTLEPARRAALIEVLVIRLQLPPTRPPADQRDHILSIREQLNALPPEQVCLLNTALNLKPVIAFNLGQHAENTGDLSLAAQTFAEAIPLCRQTQNSNLFYLATAHLANIQVTQGQLHAADQTHARALAETASFVQPSPFIALTYAGLGALQFEWDNLDAAHQHFSDGLVHARLWNLWEALIPLTMGQVLLKQRAGELHSALEILDGLGSPPLPGQELSVRAYAALLGGTESAAAWLTAHPAESSREPDPTNEFLLLTMARLMASARRTNESITFLQKIIHFAQSCGRIHTLIQAKVALAIIASQPDALLEALSLAEPEGYLSTFVMEGESLENILQHLLRQPGLEPRLQAYARKILATFDNAPRKPKQASGLVESLSERELEVLRYIAAGMSNPEIAHRLYLSPNTLKAHTQNIFLKLEVHNRVQAVSRAKELGLID